MLTDRPVEAALLPPPVSKAPPQAEPAGGATLADLEARLGARIRERPVLAVLTAFGVGYLVTRLFSRPSR